MSSFSDALTALMDQKGIVNNEVIRRTGINRSTFFKIKNGARSPSGMEMVNDLARAMRLNDDDRQALTKAYEIDQYGSYKYYGIEAIRHFCLSDVKFSRNPGVIITIPEFQEGEYVRIFRDASEVRAVLMGVLNTPSPTIRILEKRMSDIYKNGIHQASRACPEKTFYHIFRMNDTETVEVDHQLYNVNCFRNAVEIVKGTGKYFPSYYYSPTSTYAQSMEQENFILSDRYLLTYSDSFCSGVLYNNPDLLTFYGDVFERAMETSSLLIENAEQVGIFQEDTWLDMLLDNMDEAYFLIPGIGSSFFGRDSEGLFRDYISDAVEDKEALIRYRFYYGDRLQRAVKKNGQSIHIISASNALERFARTGYINEFPRHLSAPIPKKDRPAALRKWRRAVDQFNIMGTFENCITDDSSLCILATERWALVTFLSEQGEKGAYILITETSITSLLIAYLKKVELNNIIDSDGLLKYIDELIEKMNEPSIGNDKIE